MSAAGQVYEGRVTALGSQGDGIVETPGGRTHLPYTVPGDVVRLSMKGGEVAEAVRIADGPGRIPAACAHFTVCGGCALQHVRDADYAAWKRARVVEALDRQGVETEIGDLVRVAPGARRRVRLGARATRAGVVLGFKARRSHRLVDIADCPVAAPGIVAALPRLRAVLGDCLPNGATAEVSLTLVAAGLDVAVDSRAALDLAAHETLAAFAEAADLARLSWGGEPVVQRRAVRIEISGVPVDLPQDAFLQPTEAGEAALRTVVTAALSDAGTVADLYAGCGAFAIALAASGKSVRAYEAEESQVAAVNSASRRAGLRLEAETRDLRRRPLIGAELDGLDGLALDPPRAGATEQARALAASRVPVIAYVSCNPASFARDARILTEGGYRLEAVTPVDQFLWSPHVELAGVFRR